MIIGVDLPVEVSACYAEIAHGENLRFVVVQFAQRRGFADWITKKRKCKCLIFITKQEERQSCDANKHAYISC